MDSSGLPNTWSIPFVLNDTATTLIYTLSLHDALPIFKKFHAGYVAGVKTANPAAEVLPAKYTGSWSDTGLGKETARALYAAGDRKSTRLNSSHSQISYAVFCLKKKVNGFVGIAEHLVHPICFE